LQEHFEWRNVAAAAVGAGVGGAVRIGLGGTFNSLGEFGGNAARGTISGIAAGMVARAASGGRMNVAQIATDAFGNAIGNSIVENNWGGSQQEQALGSGLKVRSDIWGSTTSYGDYSPADLLLTTNGLPRSPTMIGTVDSGDAIDRAELRAQLTQPVEIDPVSGLQNISDEFLYAPQDAMFRKGVLPYRSSAAGSLVTQAANGFLSTVATAVLGGSGPTNVTSEEAATWRAANPNAAFGEQPTAQYQVDISNGTNTRSIGTTQPFVESLKDELSLGFRSLGRSLGTFVGGVSVASDENLSQSIRNQGAFDAGSNSLSVPASVFAASSPVLRFGGGADKFVLQDVRPATLVNDTMVASGNQPAWLVGTEVKSQIAPAGARFQMGVSEGQAAALMRGEPAFGDWATQTHIPSRGYARNNLSILEQFKPDLSYVVTVETTRPQLLNNGFAGPLGKYTGTGPQVQFLGTRNLKMIGQPEPLPKGR
jgi:hypothetical protein